MAEYYWPRGVLRPNNVQLTLNERNLATPPAVSGYTQVVSSGPPIWSATFGAIDLRTSNQRICWRAIAALLEGRRNIVVVPFCRGDQPRAYGSDADNVPHSDDAPHDDNAPYSQKLNEVYLADGASAGATSLSLDIVIAGTIQPGNYLSINDRLYIVRGSNDREFPTFMPHDDGSPHGDYAEYMGTPNRTSTISIWPPLRRAVSAGDWVEIDNPTCRMRLASDQEMSVDFQRLRFGNATVSFIEDLT